jgi:hypothetical protein
MFSATRLIHQRLDIPNQQIVIDHRLRIRLIDVIPAVLGTDLALACVSACIFSADSGNSCCMTGSCFMVLMNRV